MEGKNLFLKVFGFLCFLSGFLVFESVISKLDGNYNTGMVALKTKRVYNNSIISKSAQYAKAYRMIYSPNVTNSNEIVEQISNKTFTILAWTSSYYGPGWGMQGSKPFETCQYSNCFGTMDKKQYATSDALLFHMVFLRGFPKPRLANQKWIMHIRESPYQQGSYKRFNNVFNTTWTYHRKSDIWTNYSHVPYIPGGLLVKRTVEDYKLVTKDYAAGKTKMAAWFVSHCGVQSHRLKFVKNLQKHIQVDVYGSCGKLKCGSRSDKRNVKCFKTLERDYRFYFSFENSICDDYVTEKLWKALNLNIVPVVMGAYNYSELLPPKSYIDIKDYASLEELAAYLKLLHSNDKLYNEYLQWKGRYDIVKHPPMACSVCEYLNKAKGVRKVYDHLDLFWSRENDCQNPANFYNMDASVWQ